MWERAVIRDALISIGIYWALLLVSLIGTPLSLISLALLPLPTLVFTAKHTRKAGAVLTLVQILLQMGFLFLFGLLWVMLTAVATVTGWGMGQFHHNVRRNIQGLLLTGTLCVLTGSVLIVWVLSSVFGFTLVGQLNEQWDATVAIYEEVWGQLGLQVNEQELAAIQDVMQALIPFGFLVFSVGVALLNHWVGRHVLARMGVAVVKLPSFQSWQFPRSLLVGYVASVILLLVAPPEGFFFSVGATGMWLLQLLFVVQACSLIASLIFRGKQVPPLWVGLLVLLLLPFILLVMLFLYVPLFFLGMIDVGFRLRDKFRKT